MTHPEDAINAVGLVKRYRGTTALAGVDLRVPAGTVLGLLGPNGAARPQRSASWPRCCRWTLGTPPSPGTT